LTTRSSLFVAQPRLSRNGRTRTHT
jgi:hypothetical protein